MGAHKCKGGMGFRGLECFNKVLLAKQLWRISTQPKSLAATILQEKYIKYENIMEVKVKGYNFLLWKSLLVASEVFEHGLRWRVGNGKKISIWGDQWILTQNSFKIKSLIEILSTLATIEDLLTERGDRWNVNLI